MGGGGVRSNYPLNSALNINSLSPNKFQLLTALYPVIPIRQIQKIFSIEMCNKSAPYLHLKSVNRATNKMFFCVFWY